MGYKLAEVALKRKHVVTLISGPTKLRPPKVNKFIPIETAGDLFETIKEEIAKSDILIMCAAVSDFKARHFINKKIKRTSRLLLELIPNKDLLRNLSRYKKGKVFIGFSLETENLIENSYRKLREKSLDLIVGNILTKRCNPFGNNKLDVYIIDKAGTVTKISKKNKAFIAHVLLDKIEKLWYLKNNGKHDQ